VVASQLAASQQPVAQANPIAPIAQQAGINPSMGNASESVVLPGVVHPSAIAESIKMPVIEAPVIKKEEEQPVAVEQEQSAVTPESLTTAAAAAVMPQESSTQTKSGQKKEQTLSTQANAENKVGVKKEQDFEKKKKRKQQTGLIEINYDNEDLTRIINDFATLQNINIIMPYGANAITQKITFKLPHRVPLAEAVRLFNSLLDLAGYGLVPHGEFYSIVKNDPNIARETLPLFVSVAPKDLPDDGRIQVVYYLKNLRVPNAPQGAEPLNLILNDMLSPNRNYNFDTKSNAVIISDKASNIKAAMNMILELDDMGIRDIIRSVRLFNSSASTVAALLQTQIIATTGGEARVKTETGLYFSAGTKIVADNRTNSLIVMGKEPAVERVIEFVQEYLDVAIESGRSILHYYELQYLDAEQFAPVLKNIVSAQLGASGQATTEHAGGPAKGFDGVVVTAESVVEEQVTAAKLAEGAKTDTVLKGKVYRGGNRLIIAAKTQDWQRIEALIKKLDVPQKQVIIQVVIVDFTANNNKILGAQTRNPSTLQLPAGITFQSAQLTGPLLKGVNPTTVPSTPPDLATDLLMLLAGTPPAPNASAATALTTANPGSLILSINDPSPVTPGIWTFLQWLNAFGEVKVLSHPYLVLLNNRKGEEAISQIKRQQDTASIGEGGAAITKIVDVTASLKISIVPRASSLERVNLQISVVINDFTNPAVATDYTITSREVHTNVNMGSGQMLVLGGLSRIDDDESDNETPLLGRIPIIRWFFANSQKNIIKTNIAIFVIPTIIDPKSRFGMNKYTRDKVDGGYDDVVEGSLFDQMKDPVTYLFFRDPTQSSPQMLDEYLSESKGDFVRPEKTRRRRGPRNPAVDEQDRKIISRKNGTTVFESTPCHGKDVSTVLHQNSSKRHRPESRKLIVEQRVAQQPIMRQPVAPQPAVKKNVIATASQQLKQQLALEKNPFLTP